MLDKRDPVVRVGCAGSKAVIAAGGEFDCDSCHLFLEAVEQALAFGCRQIVIDFRLVTFIDAGTVAVLLACRQLASQHAATMVVHRVQGTAAWVLDAVDARTLLCGLAQDAERPVSPGRHRPDYFADQDANTVAGNKKRPSGSVQRVVSQSGRLFRRTRLFNDPWRQIGKNHRTETRPAEDGQSDASAPPDAD